MKEVQSYLGLDYYIGGHDDAIIMMYVSSLLHAVTPKY